MAYWHERWACTPEIKEEFRADARARLRDLADALGFAKKSYQVRYERGGRGACGAVTLRHEKIRVCVGHTALGGWEIRLSRTGRSDFDNLAHFEPMYLLNDIEALALRVRGVMIADRDAPP